MADNYLLGRHDNLFFFNRKGETDAAISVLTQCSLALSRSLQSTGSAVDTILPHMAESYTLLAKWLQQSLESSASSSAATPLKNIATLKELANAGTGSGDDQAALVSKLMERASQFCPSSSEAWLAWGLYQYSGAQQLTGVESLLAASGLPAEDVTRLADAFDELTGDVEKVLTSDAVLVKKPAVLKRLVSQVRERRTSAASGYNGSLKAFFEYFESSRVERLLDSPAGHGRRDAPRVAYPQSPTEPRRCGRRFQPNRFPRDGADAFGRLAVHHSAVAVADAARPAVAPHPDEQTAGPSGVGMAPVARLPRGGRRCRIGLVLVDGTPCRSVFPSSPTFHLAKFLSLFLDLKETGEREEEEESSNCPAAQLQRVYRDVMEGEMAARAPEMMGDVRLLLTELRRLVLLWDELWVAVLQQMHPQVEQLIQKLQSQSQKLNKKTGLSEADKKDLLHQHFVVLFKPVGSIYLLAIFIFFLIFVVGQKGFAGPGSCCQGNERGAADSARELVHSALQ